MSIMAFMGVILFIFSRDISEIFTNDENAAELSGRVLRMISISEPLFGLSIMMQGVLEGMGETKKIFLWSSISMWLFRVLLCFGVTRVIIGKLEVAWMYRR